MTTLLKYVFSCFTVDDPIDACPVYFGGGVWGILAGKIFTSNGLLESTNFNDNLWVCNMFYSEYVISFTVVFLNTFYTILNRIC